MERIEILKQKIDSDKRIIIDLWQINNDNFSFNLYRFDRMGFKCRLQSEKIKLSDFDENEIIKSIKNSLKITDFLEVKPEIKLTFIEQCDNFLLDFCKKFL